MDAFYASVEALDDPSLAGRAVIVGGSGARSVVCACSYEARRFGVRSAIPMRQALEMCPQAVCIRPRMERYREISRGIFALLRERTERVEQMSVDEGYVDISDLARSDAEALEIGREIQAAIQERFALPSSVGIAPCKFIAKIASDLRKPRALVQVVESEVDAFLAPLGVERIPGVGKVGRKKLHGIGVETIADLRAQSREMLTALFGRWGERLHDYARGIDPRPIVTERERKSLGTEKTFETDLIDLAAIGEALDAQCAKVAGWLERRDLRVHTVTVKVRYANFESVTRRRTFAHVIAGANELAGVARDLLALTEAGRRRIRLVGVTVSQFAEASEAGELPLFAQ